MHNEISLHIILLCIYYEVRYFVFLMMGSDMMKIEKINENQIRCTLTKEDLADRELKLSELAYGTEKAKSLFRDMMQQAAYEFGFEAEDIPLMIEAIPLSADCIVLIITKVEDPEELDTRFSKFSPSTDEEASNNSSESTSAEGADGILDLYKRIHDEKIRAEQQQQQKDSFVPLNSTLKKPLEKTEQKNAVVTLNLTKLYMLHNLDTVTRLAVILKGFYHGDNSLYKNPANRKYFLIINKSSHTPEEFNKVCNILSEYGTQERFSSASEAFLEEHYEPIIKNEALQVLAEI